MKQPAKNRVRDLNGHIRLRGGSYNTAPADHERMRVATDAALKNREDIAKRVRNRDRRMFSA